MRIFLIGPMGAGKSTIGKKLSELLHLSFLDSDIFLEQEHQNSMRQLIAKHGEVWFREQEQLAIEKLTKIPNTVLATGGGSILHVGAREHLRSRGVVCYLRVSPQQQLLRLQNDNSRALLPDPNQRLKFFEEMQLQRRDLYASISDIELLTDNLSIEEVALQLYSMSFGAGAKSID
jgi:shikimate kinase